MLVPTATYLYAFDSPSVHGDVASFEAQAGGDTLAVPRTGTISFFDGTTLLGTVPLPSGGTVIFSTSRLGDGDHSITATYNGDRNYAAGTSSVVDQLVEGRPTVALTSSPNPAGVGAGVTLKAHVLGAYPSPGAPTGSVTFTDGSDVLGSAPLSGAAYATFATSSLGLGSHPITATYDGDANYTTATSPVLTEVVGGTSSVTVSSPKAFVDLTAASVEVTAHVTVTPKTVAPTGVVTFDDAAGTLGIVPVSSAGVASLSFAPGGLGVGPTGITASYGGDPAYAGSTSAPLALDVVVPTTTTVTASPSPALAGATVMLVAHVVAEYPKFAAPTGRVTFTDETDSTVLGTVSVNLGGYAELSTSSLPSGVLAIATSYGGDARTGPSVAPVRHLTVGDPVKVTLWSSVDPAVAGEPVTLKAKVVGNPEAAGVPSGEVTFIDGPVASGTVLGSAALGALGYASVTVPLGEGAHTITAVYQPATGSAYLGRAGAAITETVTAPPGGSPPPVPGVAHRSPATAAFRRAPATLRLPGLVAL